MFLFVMEFKAGRAVLPKDCRTAKSRHKKTPSVDITDGASRGLLYGNSPFSRAGVRRTMRTIGILPGTTTICRMSWTVVSLSVGIIS